MRADEFGVSKSQTRTNMLREVAEIVTRMAKEGDEGGTGGGGGGGGGEMGRDAQIYANAFPTSNILEKGFNSIKAGLGIGAGIKKFLDDEEDEEDIQEQLEIAEDETFDDSSAAKDHLDIEQVTRDSLMAKSSIGSKRRMTKLIKAGDTATLQGKRLGGAGGQGVGLDDLDMEGWLEKKSPSHNLWQPRYFKLIVNFKDKAKGAEFSWYKRDDAEKQNSIFLGDIVEPPKVLLSNRALVTHQDTRMVKLRNKEEDGPKWADIECKKGTEDYFEFTISANMKKKKTREIVLRSNDIDVMLSWVNGITVLWMKFTGQWDMSITTAETGEGIGESEIEMKKERGSANGFGSLGEISEEVGGEEDEEMGKRAPTQTGSREGNAGALKRPSGGRKAKGRMSMALNADTNVDALLVNLGLEMPSDKVEKEGRGSMALDMNTIELDARSTGEARVTIAPKGIHEETEEERDEEEDESSTKIGKGKMSATLLRKDTQSSTAGEGAAGDADEFLPLPCCVII